MRAVYDFANKVPRFLVCHSDSSVMSFYGTLTYLWKGGVVMSGCF